MGNGRRSNEDQNVSKNTFGMSLVYLQAQNKQTDKQTNIQHEKTYKTISMFYLTLVAVVLVQGRPQTLETPSNKVSDGGDTLIQQGRNMLAEFLLKDAALDTHKFKQDHGCYKNIYKECTHDSACGCHLKCLGTMKNNRIVKRCISPTYPLIR
ncbi:uncharacterized protein [Clytia hemisphaerica]|uniref:uncharacterized protein n=1 Tax=Clytia hemisphaerica TaxID=252671 RepID=UPI0034D72462